MLFLVVVAISTCFSTSVTIETQTESNPNVVEMSTSIISSEYDTRQYRLVTLDNKLDVLLISDAEAEKVRKARSTKFQIFTLISGP